MTEKTTPLVSVLLPARDAGRYLRPAVESILRQTLSDLELIVIDDGSRDETAAILDEIGDRRLRVLRSDEPRGLAGSLNRGLEQATGRYVARMDADDVALPQRLEREVARLEREPEVSIVGAGIVEIDERDRFGLTHIVPAGVLATRWRSLFGTPFLHPTVVFERALIERHDLRYETSFEAGEPEDYELWVRLLEVAEGDNLPEPLVLYRLHPGQASQRRSTEQLELRRAIALRQIASTLPGLEGERAELAWRVGDAREIQPERVDEAVSAYLELLTAFSHRHASREPELARVRELAARSISRAALRAQRSSRARLLRLALSLDPALAARGAGRRLRARSLGRSLREQARPWLEALQVPRPEEERQLRVVVVSPEPTPYRAPLFDRVAARPELDLSVVYASQTVAGRAWSVELKHPHVFLRGLVIPGLRPLFRHDYPLNARVWKTLREARPDVVVVTGWSMFASQAAILWCRAHKVPYLMFVSSHDAAPRPGWRRLVKGTVVPRVLRKAAGALVLGSLARESLIERGARADRIRVFANTVDVSEWTKRAEELSAKRDELRVALDVSGEDVLVLSVARLAPEKGLDTLIRAIAEAGDPRLVLVIAGSGSERPALERLAADLGVRLHLTGDVPWARLPELYVAADVFALLSSHEPWAVVVNEAMACGLPLLLSDQVGAAHDLLREGENGMLVRTGDVTAAAAALRGLAADPEARRRAGARSRELIADWGYEPSVENFVTAVREAAAGLPS